MYAHSRTPRKSPANWKSEDSTDNISHFPSLEGYDEYHRAKDILHVMRLLGHKNIKNTLVYMQLVTFEDDNYLCKAASDVKEARELVEASYEYVCDTDNVKLRARIDCSFSAF